MVPNFLRTLELLLTYILFKLWACLNSIQMPSDGPKWKLNCILVNKCHYYQYRYLQGRFNQNLVCLAFRLGLSPRVGWCVVTWDIDSLSFQTILTAVQLSNTTLNMYGLQYKNMHTKPHTCSPISWTELMGMVILLWWTGKEWLVEGETASQGTSQSRRKIFLPFLPFLPTVRQ